MRAALIAFFLAAFVMVSHAGTQEADRERSPAEELRFQTSPTILEWLQLRVEAASIKASIGTPGDHYKEVEDEISSRRESSRIAYTQVLHQIKGRLEAERLLKEFFSVWLATLDGVKPQGGESKRVYHSRQGESLRRLNEAWYRFETEVESL